MLGRGGGTAASTLSLLAVLAGVVAGVDVAALVVSADAAVAEAAVDAAVDAVAAVATVFVVGGAAATGCTAALPFCSSAANGTLSRAIAMTFVPAPLIAKSCVAFGVVDAVPETVVGGAAIVAGSVAAGVVTEELPAALAPPRRKSAAAVKSERVLTLKSPAACALAFAAGDCVEEVNASVVGAGGVFAGAELCGETLAAVSGALCSVCAWVCD
jgi:hypothetical protein